MQLDFKPEVIELQRAKLAQLNTFVDPSGNASAQETRFRHERIRDFFTHFSFLEMTAQEQAEYAGDARFAGVFPYLARSMASSAALALREHLITMAAQLEDHRVSDSFVRELSWRQRLTADDPGWLLEHDLPPAKSADRALMELSNTQVEIGERIAALQQDMAISRKITRILISADSAELLDGAHRLLVAIGARDLPDTSRFGIKMEAPGGHPFLLVVLGQKNAIRPYHVALLRARIEAVTMSKLVVVNSQVLTDPIGRFDEFTAEMHGALQSAGAVVLPATELYADYYAVTTSAFAPETWSRLMQAWMPELQGNPV